MDAMTNLFFSTDKYKSLLLLLTKVKDLVRVRSVLAFRNVAAFNWSGIQLSPFWAYQEN